jgi:hypothetical protein
MYRHIVEVVALLADKGFAVVRERFGRHAGRDRKLGGAHRLPLPMHGDLNGGV